MRSPLRRELTRALYMVDRGWEQLVGWRALGIRRRDLVLDVGSGGHPFIRADVLCDKFLLDHSQRQGGESLVVDRPLVIADATRLPFRDRTFDFSRSSHLLEHLDDPAAHLRELQRVSRRGVVITPSAAWERLYPIAAHRWLITLAGGRLRVAARPEPVTDEAVARLFHGGLDRYGLSYFWNYFRDVFEVHYRWRETIEFEIAPGGPGPGHPAGPEPMDAPAGEVVDAPGKRRLKLLASRVVRRLCSAHYGADLWSLVVCPACHGPLDRRGETVQCGQCARTYGLHDGRIPVLLP